MHFLLTPVGSSGDVYPFIAIGRELRVRGHRVTVMTSEPFSEAVEDAGLHFVSGWSVDMYDRVTRDPDLWHPRRGLALILRTAAQAMREAYRLLDQMFVAGDTVLVGHALSFASRVFEETRSVPAVTLHLAPSALRSEHAQPVMVPGLDLSRTPRWIKRTLWWLIDRAMVDPNIAPALNAWRSELGLAPVGRIFADWIHSPRAVIGLFPYWFAPPQPDWPQQLKLTGFPLYDQVGHHRPYEALDQFLEADDVPPVAFTPGSGNRQAKAFFQTAVEACSILNRRAVFVTPYAEQVPRDLPPQVMHVSYTPFSNLFSRCAAVVHHGGIGTCAQGLAGGIPQLIMPIAFDQPDNASRLTRLGAGAWISPRRFRPRRVAAVLDGLINDPDVERTCRSLQQTVRAARPIQKTCDLIELAGN